MPAGLDAWMAGYRWRQVAMTRPPVVKEEPGYHVDVRKTGREWIVMVTRAGEPSRKKQAESRFLGWFVVTGDRADMVSTDVVRQDYWLAHQDVGLPLPQSKRGAGVHLLLDSDERVTRGRGCLRGVVRGDDLFEEAERMLREGMA